MLITALLACSGDPASDSAADTTADSGVADTTDTTDTVEVPEGTFGQTPAVALAAPEFSATNYDGTPRGIADLTDGPTVVWFFPAAGTYG